MLYPKLCLKQPDLEKVPETLKIRIAIWRSSYNYIFNYIYHYLVSVGSLNVLAVVHNLAVGVGVLEEHTAQTRRLVVKRLVVSYYHLAK